MDDEKITERGNALAQRYAQDNVPENHLGMVLAHLKRHRRPEATRELLAALPTSAFARRTRGTRTQLEALGRHVKAALSQVSSWDDAARIVGWAEESSSPLTAPRLRRVLGKALIDAFCLFGRPLCQERQSHVPSQAAEHCHLAGSCPYGVFYARSRTQRPPFALYVTSDTGGLDLVELTFFGDACAMYPWMLASLERALTMGLGRERRQWRIERVLKVTADARRQTLCGRDLTRLPADVAPESFRLTADPLSPGPTTVELLSPTRLIHDGRIWPRDEPVPFELLIARILGRFRELYGDGASDLLRKPVRAEIEAAASRVPLVADETRWIEVKDYSARMDRELRLDGLTGRLRYGEPAGCFLPLLQVGEVLHLGKNPTAGCGRMRICRNSLP